MVYASTMVHFVKIKPLEIASGPRAGKDQTSEQFLAQVQEGARVTELKSRKVELKF